MQEAEGGQMKSSFPSTL
ncbi:hypothetical protein A2U01_0099127, partial [Trifolium medium]|nr:hypothetical protein [Trifolium medium]